MARPIKLRDSAGAYVRKRIPADVQQLLEGLPKSYRPNGWGRATIKVSLRVHASDLAAVTAAQARVATEPHRVCRRPFRLSHAAWERSSIWA